VIEGFQLLLLFGISDVFIYKVLLLLCQPPLLLHDTLDTLTLDELLSVMFHSRIVLPQVGVRLTL
jgi:hypothetical protein